MTAPLPRIARRLALILVAAAAAGSGAAAALPANAGTRAPRCFGAAARVPGHPCTNPALQTLVTPTPGDALLSTDAPCTPEESWRVLSVCAFGDPPQRAKATVALLGDSHASHWRAALAVAARTEGWRGISLTRSSCPFTQANARIAPEAQGPCRENNVEAVQWLDAHPEVSTVFVSAHSGARVFTAPGQEALDTKIAGYVAAWRALPASVTRIIVLRDVPTHPLRTSTCIDDAIAADRPPIPACAVRRAGALLPDAEVVAAQRLHSSRVRVIDLTPFMCGPAECYPVVGGVLVNKDTDHLSQAFSATLGPYLLSRAIRLQRGG